MQQSEKLVEEIQKGLLQWYEFMPHSRVLYIGGEKEAAAQFLKNCPLQFVSASCTQICRDTGLKTHTQVFDYIVSTAAPELYSDPKALLSMARHLLKPEGRMLLAMHNRLGIRYFCGDRDPYTERNFDGIEGYRRAYSRKEDTFRGRMYSQAELRQMLAEAGWESARFYSVYPGLENPALLYAEDYLPNEDLTNRVFPAYHYPDCVFLEEEGLYGSLIENGLFHKMANAYLIECAPDGSYSDVSHVTSSLERGRERAFFTIVHKSGVVEKRAAYPEGEKQLEKLAANSRDLAAYGIAVVEGEMKHGAYVMPYIQAETAQIYLKRLLYNNTDTSSPEKNADEEKIDKDVGTDKFLQEMDRFRDLILQSSEIVKPDTGDGEGAVLRRGYVDMVPLNCFYVNGEFVFYDQEFCEEYYPANAIIARMINTFYAGSRDLQKWVPIELLYERYGLTKNLERWKKMEWEFLTELRQEKQLKKFHEQFRRKNEVVNSNRQRMNYSEKMYQRLFIDIFRNADTRKLLLFGSGNFAKRFLALYQQDYPVYAVIDNNEENWGKQVEGIEIQGPHILNRLQSGEYKVLICIKNYLSVMKQLDGMGVTEYSVYDPNKEYPRKRKPTAPVQTSDNKEAVQKKYHTGYIAGVFDLYHIGHLNMFRRAKEQCEYLIVGVVTDEGVRRYKKKEPFIPFDERIEMVRSCRYVDEAVEIPLQFGGTRDAYLLHHFDCQFSGSDYVDDPNWLADKEFLEKNGAEMVFFSYTEGTSSTKIKSLIEKQLLS